jgi:hypothetical protein
MAIKFAYRSRPGDASRSVRRTTCARWSNGLYHSTIKEAWRGAGRILVYYAGARDRRQPSFGGSHLGPTNDGRSYGIWAKGPPYIQWIKHVKSHAMQVSEKSWTADGHKRRETSHLSTVAEYCEQQPKLESLVTHGPCLCKQVQTIGSSGTREHTVRVLRFAFIFPVPFARHSTLN